ncbi:MAG: N-acetylmuramoyl-L-alanine amidase [Nitrospinota bacterium]
MLLVCGLLFSLANLAFASPSGDLYFMAQKSYYQLMASEEKKKFRHHWMKTINMFSRVIDLYPKSKEAYKAEFTTGKLFEGLNSVSKNSKDIDRALRHYQNVLKNYPSGNLSDDALFRVGEIYLAKNSLASASETFKKISDNYPKGDQAKKALQKFKSIKVVSNKNHTATVTRPKSSDSKVFKPKVAKIAKKQKLKQAPSVVIDSDKKKIVAKFKKKAQGNKSEKQKTQVARKGQKRVVKNIRKTPRANPSPQVAKASIKPPVSPKKRIRIKDGFGNGYLYTPKKLRRGQTNSPLIVIDAGHGGKDDGARSASGIKEKDINLKIARHVKTFLVNRYKYCVVMTRKDDTFIPLRDRSKISNKRNADLFVSIHANAAKRKSAHGIETYFLGTSHNKEALEVAARENGELVQSVKDNQVQQILASLITTTKINDSSRLAGRVQENLYQNTRKTYRYQKNLGVKEGPFYVLHGADMPSILVEVGFLTNRREAKMLSQSEYLYRVASSIAEGIHKYLQDKGPSI